MIAVLSLHIAFCSACHGAPPPPLRIVKSRLYELDPATGRATVIHEVPNRVISIVAFSKDMVCLREGGDESQPNQTLIGRLKGVSLESRKVVWSHAADDEMYIRYFREINSPVNPRNHIARGQMSDDVGPLVIATQFGDEKKLAAVDMSTGDVLWEYRLGFSSVTVQSIPIARGNFVVYTTNQETMVLDRKSGKEILTAPPAGRFVLDQDDLYGCVNRLSTSATEDSALWHVDLKRREVIQRRVESGTHGILGVAENVLVCYQRFIDPLSTKTELKCRISGRNREDISQVMWETAELDGSVGDETRFLVAGTEFFFDKVNPVVIDLVSGRSRPFVIPATVRWNPVAMLDGNVYCAEQQIIKQYRLTSISDNSWSWEPDMGNYAEYKGNPRMKRDVYCAQAVAHANKIYLVFSQTNRPEKLD